METIEELKRKREYANFLIKNGLGNICEYSVVELIDSENEHNSVCEELQEKGMKHIRSKKVITMPDDLFIYHLANTYPRNTSFLLHMPYSSDAIAELSTTLLCGHKIYLGGYTTKPTERKQMINEINKVMDFLKMVGANQTNIVHEELQHSYAYLLKAKR